MQMRRLLLVCLALLFGILNAAAQTRAITGRVTDQNNEGLPGVTVLVKGTSVGTSTGGDGSFSLSAPETATTLVFSYIGFATVERPISENVTVAMATDAKQLGEVVVTALGVERNRNSLAYSATQIDGTDVTKARNPNAINGLSGKVAGLNIQQSNGLGASTNVTIRGTKSLFGNNQALFVVDGVPISNQNTNSLDQRTGRGGYDYGNAAADINPDDIASTTILKGAAATALYGSRASNGVILITTKKGRKGLGVTLNLGTTIGKFDKSTFMKYQNKYGAGYYPFYGPNEDQYFNELPDGSLVVPFSEDASYGAAFDPNLKVLQWDAFYPTEPGFGKARAWTAAENGPETFFQNSVNTNNSVTIDGGNEMGTFKLGYSNIHDRGILPNSKINKNVVNFAGSLNLTSKLTTSVSANFSKVDGLGRYGTGYGSGNLMTNFRQWWQTNVDIKQQKDAYFRNRENITWNRTSANNSNAIYWDNPYFTRYENYQNDSRYRLFGNVAANYKVTDWFSVLGRVTMDTYDERQEERRAIGGTTNDGPAYYSLYNGTAREYNYDLLGNFKKNFSEDFSLQGVVGANMRRQYFNNVRSQTNGGLIVPRLYSLSNSVNPLSAPIENDQSIGVDGIFANATLGYRDMLFLDLTGRRDKSTTLPKGNNTYFYPSASVGFVFSELLKDTPWLSYGKVRANYAQVGNDAPIFSVTDTYNYVLSDVDGSQVSTFGSTALFSVSNTKNNPNLKPERTKSTEAGIDLAFLQSRVGFDFTYYKQNTVDQIIPVNVSTATGYSFRYVNAGEVQNKGVEIGAFVTPIKNDNFSWTINANWYRNRNEVVSLYNDLDNLVLATYQGGVSSNATVGQPFGTLRGENFVYKDGQKVILPNGRYARSTTANEVIGNPTPDWKGGVSNTVAYKGVSLYFLVDIRKGGDVFSLDRYYGLATGLSPETAEKNELGNESRLPLSQGGGVILDGVQADGTKNTVRIANEQFGLYGYRRNPAAGFIYDGSYVKLREVALTYSIPSALLAKIGGFKAVDVSIVGRNLWIIHKNLPMADPEESLSSGNLGQGYQSGAYPAVRTLGGNIRLSF